MQIEISVGFGAVERDLRVEAPEDACLGDVLPAVAAEVGAPAQTPVWCGADLMAASTPFRDPRLRTGARLRFGAPAAAPERVAVLALHVIGGPAAGAVRPLERGRLTIGRAAGNALVLADGNVSRRHAVIEVSASAITVSDTGSTNGTLVNGRPVPPAGARLQPDDVVRVGDSLLTVATPIAVPASVHPQPDGSLGLARPPRQHARVMREAFVQPQTAQPSPPRAVAWSAALLPALAGAVIAWITGQPQFLLFALLSPVMLISAALGDRLQWRRSRRTAVREAAARRERFDAEIAAALTAETRARRQAAADPATVGRAVAVPDTTVWAREPGDKDFLHVRLGLAGLPSAVTIRDGPAESPAGTLPDVPLCADLADGPLGITGPARVAAAVARWLVGQLAALSSPAHLEFALLVPATREAQWRWARWLPQLGAKVAWSAQDVAALLQDLSAIVEQRREQRGSAAGRWPGSWLVVVVDALEPGTDVTGAAEVLACGSDAGVTAIWLTGDPASLPGPCPAVAQVVGVTGTQVRLRANGAETAAVLDQVSAAWADRLARNLAPLRDASAGASTALPAECTLLTTLGLDDLAADDLVARWAASDGAARAVVGTTSTGPLAVDLTADGPHALVAGTTGAGKSELLRTLVAGLAVSHPPSELNLLLIDYKGGAAFAGCDRLPHTAGLVTDLDSYLTRRALRSLHAELRRRERLFAAAGVADLPAYRRTGAVELIPRLVIVVDEFAALADELPDFVSGLVGVAQRGRSLGLHLVLATQRPGSAVSPEIRANTALRIALRVTDVSESRDLIGSPLAAELDRRHPGRGYLRTGSTLTCFQTAHSSAVTDPDPKPTEVGLLDGWRRLARPQPAGTRDDLARLVDALRKAARESAAPPAHSPWPPPLPARLPASELAPATRAGSIVLGQVDLPDEQRQPPYEVDLADGGSLLIAGTARSGRTTALTALATIACTSLPPSELHLHVVAAAGGLADAVRGLAQCATVLGPAEIALVPRLLHRLMREADLRRTGTAPGQVAAPPTLLVLIDSWDALGAGLAEAEAAAVTEKLIALIRGARGSGLFVAVTGERAALNPRLAGAFTERILLRLPDRLDLGLLGVRPRDLPPSLPPGRGIRSSDGALVQLAHVDDAAAGAMAVRQRYPWPDRRADAIRVRPLPERVDLADLPVAAGRLALGVAGDECRPVSVDPLTGARRLLVAGPPRSGRTSFLRLLAAQAPAAGWSTLVVAPDRSGLAHDASALGIPLYGPAADAPGAPTAPTLVLVDDCETFNETDVGTQLTSWARTGELPIALVVAGRADDLATSYRGVGAEVRRSRCGILLCPGPLDGELLGVRLPRPNGGMPPGRGFAVGEPSWGSAFETAEPVPIQLAAPGRATQPSGLPMCG